MEHSHGKNCHRARRVNVMRKLLRSLPTLSTASQQDRERTSRRLPDARSHQGALPKAPYTGEGVPKSRSWMSTIGCGAEQVQLEGTLIDGQAQREDRYVVIAAATVAVRVVVPSVATRRKGSFDTTIMLGMRVGEQRYAAESFPSTVGASQH